MATLPVREMVLYKHGVSFFVREGSVDGETIALTFRRDEINDVLKSLAVVDKNGGQVLGIHYQTPMDQDARFASSSIRLSDDASLRDLLTGLRGRKAALAFEVTPGTVDTVIGRIIGLDEPSFPGQGAMTSDTLNQLTVSVLADDEHVRVYRLGMLRALRIHDAQAGHDLSYFLDTSMDEDERRTVNVRLSVGEHQLAVYYVAPSPTWRVSYRLVAQADEGSESGKALLQGWGLFDNRLEEDLQDVRITLVAGQPISFIYDLYTSRIPYRPWIQDEATVAPGPIEYERAITLDSELEAPEERARGVGIIARKAAPAPALARFGSGDSHFMSPANVSESVKSNATTKDSGEFFQYIVSTPVTIKRGESALVPILSHEIKYERELLYNGSKLPQHPVVALRFSNSTGLTLERGPVTVVENGDYKGDAVVPFSKSDQSVYLAFAVELGVKVTERPKFMSDETMSLTIKDAYFTYEYYQFTSTTYIIENTTARPVTITIETPIESGWDLFNTPLPHAENASDQRWKVSLQDRSKTEFTITRRHKHSRHEEVRRLEYRKLQEFIQKRWLHEGALKQLTEMLDTLARIEQAKAQQAELDKERKTLYDKQEQLRANLSALGASEAEAPLRNRMLGQLEASQDRLETIEQETLTLKQQIIAAEQQVSAIIAGLG